MSKKRHSFSAEFKFRVALEAAKGAKTINELVSVHGVHPSQIRQWKCELLDEGSSTFTNNAIRQQRDQETSVILFGLNHGTTDFHSYEHKAIKSPMSSRLSGNLTFNLVLHKMLTKELKSLTNVAGMVEYRPAPCTCRTYCRKDAMNLTKTTALCSIPVEPRASLPKSSERKPINSRILKRLNGSATKG